MTVTPGPTRSRLDPDPVPRRTSLGLISLWSMAATFLFATVGMFRLPKAAVLEVAVEEVPGHAPEALPVGEPFVPPGRAVAVFRDIDGVRFPRSARTSAVSCAPAPGGFECPCHGSGFAPTAP